MPLSIVATYSEQLWSLQCTALKFSVLPCAPSYNRIVVGAKCYSVSNSTLEIDEV